VDDSSYDAVQHRERTADMLFEGRLKAKWLLQDLKRLRVVEANGKEKGSTKKDRLNVITQPLRTPMEMARMDPSSFQQWVEGPTHLDIIKEAIATLSSSSVTTHDDGKDVASQGFQGYTHIHGVMDDLEAMIANSQALMEPRDSMVLKDKLKAMHHYIGAVKGAKPITLKDVQNGMTSHNDKVRSKNKGGKNSKRKRR
jgi:hypothetical protein